MTITNTFLNEIAKAINDETYLVPSHLAFGTTEVSSISNDETSISGEIGNRLELSSARTSNEIEYSSTRSGANVIDTTNGDNLKTVGVLTSSTDGSLLTGVTLSGVTQTTNFDVEVIITYTIGRE